MSSENEANIPVQDHVVEANVVVDAEFQDQQENPHAKEANFDSLSKDPVLDAGLADTEFQQVDLEVKEADEDPLDNNSEVLPVETDVVDSEFHQIDLEAMESTVDSLYKDDPLLEEMRKVARRRRWYNILAVLIGVIALIVLITTLINSNEQYSDKKSKDNQASKQNTKNDVDATKNISNIGDAPTFTCASTSLTCPNVMNGTWTKLPSDILGESDFDYAGFATALSCDGSILAVSSLHNNNKAGHVRVFQWNKSSMSWNQLGKDIDATSNFTEFGYSLTMSADGLQIAIGSRKNNDKAFEAGEVQVFGFANSDWVQVGQDLQGEFSGDHFGRSVSLSSDGKRLAVGASSNNGTDEGSGHARVFELVKVDGSDDHWVQLGQDLNGELGGDQFGRSISLSGDGTRVAIGGHTHNNANGIEDTGHVRVFGYDVSTKSWTQVANEVEGVKENEYFGIAVALSYDGNRLAVGSPHSDAYMFGVTRVYGLANGVWSQLGSNLKGGGSAIDMSIDGNRVVIGSDEGFGNGIDAGHMAVYEFSDSTLAWSQIGEDIQGNAGEKSATSVAISADGKRVVSSSPSSGAFNVTNFVGRMRIFDFC